MQEIDRLVKMANQIADNFAFHEDTVDRVAEHLARFWAPSMRQKLTEYADAGGSGLSPTATAAVQRLAASE
ncbi:MAG TPA: formate dehydrogenase subunit delta [Xanthomonadales bacterium]|nr:formate dehydrogenase subunit delta [Xanthomonadales bacterium]